MAKVLAIVALVMLPVAAMAGQWACSVTCAQGGLGADRTGTWKPEHKASERPSIDAPQGGLGGKRRG